MTNQHHRDRLVTCLVLGSIGPTVYALAQWLGVDPLASRGELWRRPGSTFGDPLFLSGYLAAVVPLTIAQAIGGVRREQKVGMWTLVALQIAALAATRSRGPLLAISGATMVAGAMVLASFGRRRPATAIAIVTALAAVASVTLAPRWLPAAGQTVTAQSETGDRRVATIGVRALLWRAAGSGIRDEPRVLGFGTGPESTARLLTKYSGPSLRQLEGQDAAPTALGAAFVALGLLTRPDYRHFATL